MSKQTFYKYFKEIGSDRVVKVSRGVGRAKLHKVNSQHPLITVLREFEETVSMETAEESLLV